MRQKHGKLLHEIIAERGMEGFLRLENEVCAALDADRAVISTGGSAVYGKEAMANYRERATLYEAYADYTVDEESCAEGLSETLQKTHSISQSILTP